ncbi:hypothetical protein [Klebsiella aerogenes]|uniref:hypothetical protein n=1 Tax=Klebsiella aerogenes TaxID=548 RepID=UPI001F17D16F|nr:hypothetical protein [Klebsiella aerogenes]
MHMRILIATLLVCFDASAKEVPLGGRASVAHDYKCVSVETGHDVTMTVQEMPGAATQVLIAEGAKKPVVRMFTATDNQSRVLRLYKYRMQGGGAEMLEISDATGIATITILHGARGEVFTSLVCDDK